MPHQPGMSEQDLVSPLSLAPPPRKEKQKITIPLVLTGSMCIFQIGIAPIWKLIGVQETGKIQMHILTI